jgi:predicted RecB family nuclease
MTDRLLTPTKITAWLDCAHYLTLKNQIEEGARQAPRSPFGEFAQLLLDKGLQHEADCLAEYERQGRSVLSIPAQDRDGHEAFAAWVERVGDPFDEGHDVIYQMPFVHDGVRGIADFLIRVTDPDTGLVSYEPVDAKLARVAAKPGHVLQLCFYADAIEAVTGVRPKHMHIWLGSGHIETLSVREFTPYWNRLRTQLADVMAADLTDTDTVPEPCEHCDFCEFHEQCDQQWRDEDSLVFVANLRTPERYALEDDGVATLAALAECDVSVDGVRDERLERLVVQASLQVLARARPDTDPPPFRLIDTTDDPVWGRGLQQLPEPDDGDVFLDFEGDPFWRPDVDLFFLFGLILRQADAKWIYKDWWANDRDEEAAATAELIEFLADRRASHPGMHVYHYNHTERTALQRLAADHGVGEVALTHQIDTGLFVDLYAVARNAVQVGTEGYGLKYLERLTTYERGHDIDKGAGAVVEYEHWMLAHDQAGLDRIAAYNEDDVRATRALRDWLVEHRRNGTPWRDAELEPEEGFPELDDLVEQLHAYGPDTTEHFLGDVIGYWRRESLAHVAPLLARCQGDPAELLDDPDVLAGLTWVGEVPRLGKTGKVLDGPAMQFTFPEQVTDGFGSSGDMVVFVPIDGGVGRSTVHRLDREAGVVDLVWNERCQEIGLVPGVVVRNDWVAQRPKPDAVNELAARVLDPAGAAPNPVSMALLRRDLPRFRPGGGPPDGRFGDGLDEMAAWATQLDHSYVAVQGPPGTGKTFRAAHLVRTLIGAGLRVGITAFSHFAIDNLLEEIVEVLTDAGELDRLHAVRRQPHAQEDDLAGIKYATTNGPCARQEFNVVAGTTWLFAGKDMAAAPVDVLLVDEAGQLALADALAAARSTHNLVLLGDPSQLPQVSKALHPHRSGDSVLQHVLGDDVTMPDDRGVFLTETRRMHPDICRFISEEIYEGRLQSHDSCAGQTTDFGTGLRWLRAEHDGCITESEEEAELVAGQILRMIDSPWTNEKGEQGPLTADDFMVVAPYNDQVNLIRDRLRSDPRTRDVAVGTVDKFQGRQAAVVFFTMTTSSGVDISHGADFLFSRNRLNVAISRARCLAYLVCTEQLLNSRARDVEQMRLISTLCAFVEWSQRTG